ncbi:hypothetical protein CAL19_12055 [Bordetella genomosp. 7]|uniref:TadE-like domain-containing protein n=1 Tax=Bordetella genomosp. 7 TaxID=1416805 RepID=A0A261QYL5_9BORD|nr:hypothetical protein CAL19_12055 [Bordetella genomosp. 7]
MDAPHHGRGGCESHRRLWAGVRPEVPVLGARRGHPAGRPACGDIPGGFALAGAAATSAPGAVRHIPGIGRAQRGAYAVEFALIFLAFFLVLYGIMMYGMIFTAQQSLNLAAQDAARKALQWQPGATHMQLRADAARNVALERADWITTISGEPLSVAVCSGNGRLSHANGGNCSGLIPADDPEWIEVVVSYAYGAQPLIPNLPLIQRAIVPAQLHARAAVRLGSLAAAPGS